MMYQMNKKRKQSTLGEQLRHIIKSCGQTRYRICKETGIAQETLTRFMSGERGLPLKTLEKLAAYFKLEIIRRKEY